MSEAAARPSPLRMFKLYREAPLPSPPTFGLRFNTLTIWVATGCASIAAARVLLGFSCISSVVRLPPQLSPRSAAVRHRSSAPIPKLRITADGSSPANFA